MKKTVFATSLILFGLFSGQAYAATPTPAPTKTDSSVSQKLDSQINQLKEKIASRVSELNLVEKRGMIGTVTETKSNLITLTDAAGDVRYVDVDEITKYSSPGQTKFGLAEVTKGTKISVLGIYNKQSKRILARFVNTYAQPTILSGAITAIDPKNFQITIMTADQKEIKVDVATSTKLSSYTQAEGLVKYGFSKLAVGDRVSVVGSADRTDPNVFAASRVVDFIGIPKDPRIVVTSPTTVASPAANVTTKPATPTPATRRNLSPIR